MSAPTNHVSTFRVEHGMRAIVSGIGAVQERLAAELDAQAIHRPLIVCGANVARSPVLDAVRAALGRDAVIYDGSRPHTPIETVDEGATADKTVIFGFGRVGRIVADMIREHGQDYLAVESDIDSVLTARADGYKVLFGDVGRAGLIERLEIGNAKAVVLTMDDPVQAMRTVKRVRAWCPDLTIVARARDTENAAALYKAGATDAVPETLESSLQLSEAVLVDLGMAMGPVIASIHEKRAEMRAQIMKKGELDRELPERGRRLRDALER